MILKKWRCALIAATLALSTLTVPLHAGAAQLVRGDVDGDGVVTLNDATYLLTYLGGGFAVRNPEKLDVDGNGVVSRVDAQVVLQIYADAAVNP